MHSRLIGFALLVFALAASGADAQVRGSGTGVARGGGRAPTISAPSIQAGSRGRITTGQSQITIQQNNRTDARHRMTGAAVSSSLAHAGSLSVTRRHPHHFRRHHHFFQHHRGFLHHQGFFHHDRFFLHRHFHRPRGIVIIDVPGVFGTSVTTHVLPGSHWAEPRSGTSPLADSQGRAAGQLAPFDPMPQEVVERLLALAGVKETDLVYDLGAGDGRIVIAAATKYGAKGVGFEIDPGLAKLADENVRKAGVEELVQIRQQDFRSADLSAATVITLYLSRDGNEAVKPLLLKHLKPGARVVSYMFHMGDWTPKIIESYRDAAGGAHLLYYWEIAEPPGLS